MRRVQVVQDSGFPQSMLRRTAIALAGVAAEPVQHIFFGDAPCLAA